MKKKRIKKSVKIVLFILIIIVIILLVVNSKNSNNKKVVKNTKKIDYEEVIYNKLKENNISNDFIKWVNKNYPNSLNKLNDILNKNEYKDIYWHDVTGNSYIVLNDLYNNLYDNNSNVLIDDNKTDSTIISIAGDVSLADNWSIMPQYDKRGKGIYGILSEEIVKIMKDSNMMIVNNEFSISTRGSKLNNKLYTFRANPERLKIYEEMGVDLVTLSNNHVYDFGSDAFLDTLKYLNEYNIPYIGAGNNLEEASRAYYFIINGYKFTFLNCMRAEKYIMTKEATTDSYGVFKCYDPTNMINRIKEERDKSDYIISIIHYGKEGSHELENEQVDSSKKYIDAGSDIVVGHHAHTLQGIEMYNNKPIIYNLGDFIFNDEIEDSAIFQFILDKDRNLTYKIIPAIQKNMYTDLAYDSEKLRIINDINSFSVNVTLDNDGIIKIK